MTPEVKKNRMLILDKTGHSTVEWAVDDEIETLEASKKFAEHVSKGGLAYKTTGPGEAEAIERFDKTAEEIILTPQLYGG